MVKLVKLATCNLNQWSLDFDLNLANIFRSIREAKSLGCRFRTGPELEVSGYGCEDHFLEEDTIKHCWESIHALLTSDATDDMLVDVGMPLLHKGVRYNCRLFLLNRRVVLIRPKLFLAMDGNYREARWFTEWKRQDVEVFTLPRSIRALTGQHSCPIGNAVLECDDTTIGAETCEELFTPHSPHIEMTLNGVEIIANGSGSHHQLRKLEIRLALIRNAMSKAGGAYLCK
jgi:NAD+ synthase (glutamine-hydrolysing)